MTIDISSKQNIRPSGQQVTATTWSPDEGAARQLDIERARYEAQEAYRKQMEDSTTVGQRLSTLEGEFLKLRLDIDKLLQLFTSGNEKEATN